MDIERMLKLVSKAWGRQHGYCFFPSISGVAANKEDRRNSFDEGPAFFWPRDRDKVLKWLRKQDRAGNDVYWCPMLFEEPRRLREFACDEMCLWADLDEVDPAGIRDYKPTIAWETSPADPAKGRAPHYQALWLMAAATDIQGASWMGGENHRLTQHLGADPSGWDTTQLLRLPGWPNYKPDYRGPGQGGVRGDAPVGKLLWSDGRQWLPDEFGDLPVLEVSALDLVAEDLISAVDVKEVWGKLRLKVSGRVRDHMRARDDHGADRSEVLWEIERELADAGATAAEIVALVRGTVWNKYEGRSDELQRLTIEAAKAIAARSPQAERKLEAEREGYPPPTRLTLLLQGIQPPRWIVDEIWTEGACGFIAGQPKSYKSWIALDLALSVAVGVPFMGQFESLLPGPVLYVQEEDPKTTLKARFDKVWAERTSDRLVRADNGQMKNRNRAIRVIWLPEIEAKDPDIMAYVGEGLVLSDPSWQDWLDETLSAGVDDEPYRMAIFDPLMMMLGDVDENRSVDLTEKVFKPLKLLANKHTTAICVVHHMRKAFDEGRPGSPATRGGQRMLGSVANHAWSQDSLYATYAKSGIKIERESKSAGSASFIVSNLHSATVWEPRPGRLKSLWDDEGGSSDGRRSDGKPKKHIEKGPILDALRKHGPLTRAQAAEITGLHYQTVYKQSKRLEDKGLLSFDGKLRLTENVST